MLCYSTIHVVGPKKSQKHIEQKTTKAHTKSAVIGPKKAQREKAVKRDQKVTWQKCSN
jgi:hypothetical protein